MKKPPTPWKQLLTKNMSRQEFLSHLAVLGVSMIGFSGVIKALTDQEPTQLIGPRGNTGPKGAQGPQGERSPGYEALLGDFEAHHRSTAKVHGIASVADLMLLSVVQTVTGQKVFELPAASDSAIELKVNGDAKSRLALQAGGTLEWGSGEAITDTNLYRSAANTLKTDDDLVVGGTLTAANITAGSFTPGSVLFAGTSGAIAQDNSNLFYDDATNRLGIGTASPTAALHVSNEDGATDVGNFDLYSTNLQAPVVRYGKARGSADAPADVVDQDRVMDIIGRGYVSGFKNAVEILGIVEGAPGTRPAASLRFLTGTSAIAPAERMRITEAGNVRIGSTASPDAKLTFDAATTPVGGILFGADTNLYRAGANLLRTDDTFSVTRVNAGDIAYYSILPGDSVHRFAINTTGTLIWGDGTTTDTNLYRTGANVLKTDDNFHAVANIKAQAGTALEVEIGNAVSGKPGFILNPDVNLYRSAADTLKTDDWLAAGPRFAGVGSTAGSASYLTDNVYYSGGVFKAGMADVSNLVELHRTGGFNFFAGSSVAADATPTFTLLGNLTRAGQLALPIAGSAGGLLIGGDTNLYRSAASELKTDDVFKAAQWISAAEGDASGQLRMGNVGPGGLAGLLFGTAGDTNLYRSAANTLSTTGNLIVGTRLGVNLTPSGQRAVIAGDSAVTDVILALRGMAGQTGNLQEWQDGTGLTLAEVNASGRFNFPSLGAGVSAIHVNSGGANTGSIQIITGGGYFQKTGTSGSDLAFVGSISGIGSAFLLNSEGRMQWGSAGSFDTNLFRSAANTLSTDDTLIVGTRFGVNATPSGQRAVIAGSSSVSDVILAVKGMAGQTGSLQEWQDSTGAMLARVRGGGIIDAAGLLSPNLQDVTGGGPYLSMGTTAITVLNRNSATNVPLIVKSMAGQTGNVQEWQNSTGSNLGMLSAAGALTVRRNADSNLAVEIGASSSFPMIFFAADTNLYRSAANTLKTDDSLVVDGSIKEGLDVNATSGAAATINLDNGNVHDLTLTANCTLTFSGALSGSACSFTLIARQDGVGSRTVTWPASVDWSGGTPPTLSTAASAVDVLTFITVDSGTTWLGFLSGLNMS